MCIRDSHCTQFVEGHRCIRQTTWKYISLNLIGSPSEPLAEFQCKYFCTRHGIFLFVSQGRQIQILAPQMPGKTGPSSQNHSPRGVRGWHSWCANHGSSPAGAFLPPCTADHSGEGMGWWVSPLSCGSDIHIRLPWETNMNIPCLFCIHQWSMQEDNASGYYFCKWSWNTALWYIQFEVSWLTLWSR